MHRRFFVHEVKNSGVITTTFGRLERLAGIVLDLLQLPFENRGGCGQGLQTLIAEIEPMDGAELLPARPSVDPLRSRLDGEIPRSGSGTVCIV